MKRPLLKAFFGIAGLAASVLIAVGCSAIPPVTSDSSTPEIVATSTIPRIPQVTATTSPPPVESFISPTAPEATLGATQTGVEIGGCFVIDSGKALPDHIQGAVLLIDDDTGQLELLELPNREIHPLFDGIPPIPGAKLSPGGTRIAASFRGSSADSSKTLTIADGSGNRLLEYAWKPDWITIAGWLDEEQLMMLVRDRSGADAGGLGYGFAIMRPASDSSLHTIDLPANTYTTPPLPNWDDSQPLALNADATFAAYLQLVNGYEWAYALWSYETNASLVSVETFDNRFKPVWAPSGDAVAIAYSPISDRSSVSDDIYLLDRRGNVRQLTNLTKQFDTTFIQRLSWSRDGTQIAFWLNSGMAADEFTSFGPQTLMVLDVARTSSVNTCLSGDEATSPYYSLVPAPAWSSNGQFLVIENRISDLDSRVYIVDLESHKAFQIAEQKTPLDWVKIP